MKLVIKNKNNLDISIVSDNIKFFIEDKVFTSSATREISVSEDYLTVKDGFLVERNSERETIYTLKKQTKPNLSTSIFQGTKEECEIIMKSIYDKIAEGDENIFIDIEDILGEKK